MMTFTDVESMTRVFVMTLLLYKDTNCACILPVDQKVGMSPDSSASIGKASDTAENAGSGNGEYAILCTHTVPHL